MHSASLELGVYSWVDMPEMVSVELTKLAGQGLCAFDPGLSERGSAFVLRSASGVARAYALVGDTECVRFRCTEFARAGGYVDMTGWVVFELCAQPGFAETKQVLLEQVERVARAQRVDYLLAAVPHFTTYGEFTERGFTMFGPGVGLLPADRMFLRKPLAEILVPPEGEIVLFSAASKPVGGDQKWTIRKGYEEEEDHEPPEKEAEDESKEERDVLCVKFFMDMIRKASPHLSERVDQLEIEIMDKVSKHDDEFEQIWEESPQRAAEYTLSDFFSDVSRIIE